METSLFSHYPQEEEFRLLPPISFFVRKANFEEEEDKKRRKNKEKEDRDYFELPVDEKSLPSTESSAHNLTPIGAESVTDDDLFWLLEMDRYPKRNLTNLRNVSIAQNVVTKLDYPFVGLQGQKRKTLTEKVREAFMERPRRRPLKPSPPPPNKEYKPSYEDCNNNNDFSFNSHHSVKTTPLLEKDNNNNNNEHGLLKCDLCPKLEGWKSKLALSAHRKKHFRKIKCQECGKGFKYKTNLQKHVDEVH